MNRHRIIATTFSLVACASAVLLAQTPAGASHIPNVTYGSGSFIAGQHFEHQNSGGSVLTRKVPNQCTFPVEDEFGDAGFLPSGWDNDIDSFAGASTCWVKIFEHPNYGGATLGYLASSSNVGGAMHDRTSSIRWS